MNAAILLYVYAVIRLIGWFTGAVSGGLFSLVISMLMALALGMAFQKGMAGKSLDNGTQASMMVFALGGMMLIGKIFGASTGGWGSFLLSLLLVAGIGVAIRIKRKLGAVLCLIFVLIMFCQLFTRGFSLSRIFAVVAWVIVTLLAFA